MLYFSLVCFHRPIKDAWYLGSSQCNSTSFPCFTDCFDHFNYTKISTCDGDKIGLDLTCSEKTIAYLHHTATVI